MRIPNLAIALSLAALGLVGCSASSDEASARDADPSFEAELKEATPTSPASFREVLTKDGKSQGLFAGGHPGLPGGVNNVKSQLSGRTQAIADRMAFLKQKGIKTILSLQPAEEEVLFDGQIDPSAFLHFESPEHRAASDANIKLVRKAWRSWATQDVAYGDSLIAVLKDESLRPLYIHCEYGMDRTGVAVAFQRVFIETWSAHDAFSEWRASTGRCALSNRQFDKTFNVKMADAFERTHDARFDFQILPVKEQCMAQ